MVFYIFHDYLPTEVVNLERETAEVFSALVDVYVRLNDLMPEKALFSL